MLLYRILENKPIRMGRWAGVGGGSSKTDDAL